MGGSSSSEQQMKAMLCRLAQAGAAKSSQHHRLACTATHSPHCSVAEQPGSQCCSLVEQRTCRHLSSGNTSSMEGMEMAGGSVPPGSAACITHLPGCRCSKEQGHRQRGFMSGCQEACKVEWPIRLHTHAPQLLHLHRLCRQCRSASCIAQLCGWQPLPVPQQA